MRRFPTSRTAPPARLLPLALSVALLAGCSSVHETLQGDKVDYRSSGSKTVSLDVPPDLTQLSRDPKYQMPASGSVSASTFQAGGPAASGTAAGTVNAVAPQAIGDVKLERAGTQRWLVVDQPPEKLWPQLQEFWKERGFNLTTDNPESGVMETDWAENRAKLPQDFVRRSIGRVLDSLYDTGFRDRFRTRVERTANGSEIYVSHRGMEEVYTGSQKDNTTWQTRPADPQLESEMLSRLMLKLGVKEETAKTVLATPASQPKARVLADQPGATLQLDDGFDRAWRRVGLSLDRSGFTVEDRDRASGLYFVRYVEPNPAKQDEGFFGKLFGSKDSVTPTRYRLAVKSQGETTTVAVLNAQGSPESGNTAQRIVQLLVEDLK